MKPAIDRKTVSRVRGFISGHDRFVIAYHRHPDGDALASAFLLCRMLARKKKGSLIASRDPVPRPLAFFNERFSGTASSSFFRIMDGKPLGEQLPEKFRGSPLVILDSSNPDRTGWPAGDLGLFPDVLNIDHHSDNSLFGTVNCVDPKATSIGEILFRLLVPLGIEPDPGMAELVYISLHSDTVGFSQDNMSPAARTILRDLLGRGVPLPGLNRLLRKKSLKYLRLLGRVFGRLRRDGDSAPSVLWSSCTLEDMDLTGLEYEDLDGVIDEISFTAEAEVVFLLKELRPSGFKASIRSAGTVNVKTVASFFSGGGHDKAAGFEIEGAPDECAKRIISAIRRG